MQTRSGKLFWRQQDSVLALIEEDRAISKGELCNESVGNEVDVLSECLYM